VIASAPSAPIRADPLGHPTPGPEHPGVNVREAVKYLPQRDRDSILRAHRAGRA
jgi:hypothetical protein